MIPIPGALFFPAFERELAGLHPYEVPEIIAIEPAAVAESYGSWLLGSVWTDDER